jgi:TPP-dependent 2-oxoacid decarboxylase
MERVITQALAERRPAYITVPQDCATLPVIGTPVTGVPWPRCRSTPAAFGAAMADPSRRTVLITGDGSHQLTAGDVGAMGRYGAKPVIILLNNTMYGVEEVLSPTQGHVYNVLAPWNYHELPELRPGSAGRSKIRILYIFDPGGTRSCW